jgi:hypothetical protein
MRIVAVDEPGRAAGRPSRARHFLGVGPTGRDLDGAEPVLLDVLRVAAELARGKCWASMRPPLFSLSSLVHFSKASVSGEPIASE